MKHSEGKTAVLLSIVALAQQFSSLRWSRWTAGEWLDVTKALRWPTQTVEEVLPSLSRIQYSLDSGLNATASFRNDQLVIVYVKCYTYPFSLIKPDAVKHRKGLGRIQKLFQECVPLLSGRLGEPEFVGNRRHPSFPPDEEFAIRLGSWQIPGARLTVQIRKDDTDLPYVLAMVVRPS
ncbi:MAG: hypothetical protein SNJ82_08735 [Gemmataceae bacterium]